MAGEIPGEEVTNDPGELNNHPRWQRMLIALAGPAANFVLAFVLMACVYMVHNEVDEYFSGPAVHRLHLSAKPHRQDRHPIR